VTRDRITAWLDRNFPLRHLLVAEIGADLRKRIPIRVDVADKSFFGNLMELAIGLSLCDQSPYPRLLNVLGQERSATLLPLAGYHGTSEGEAGVNRWRRCNTVSKPAGLFLTAYRLAQVTELLNPRWAGRPEPEVIARILRRHPDALPRHGNETAFEWRAFADLWTSYTNGFHSALSSYGNATAQVALLGGLRYADFLLGNTVLEVKSGRLDEDDYLTQLANQMISYSLLAHHDGHPVTSVAVYAVRYQRLLRFPIEPLLSRLAGRPIDLDSSSAALAELIRDSRREQAAST
jgi:hypothetical protein